MYTRTVGTCSICGGRVITYAYPHNGQPFCENCGAVARENFGPVIPMRPRTLWPERPPSWFMPPDTRIMDFFRQRAH